MDVLGPIRIGLAVVSVATILYAGDQDRKLRTEVLPSAPKTALAVAPLHWFSPGWCTPEGNVYRRRAIAATAVMILMWVAVLVV